MRVTLSIMLVKDVVGNFHGTYCLTVCFSAHIYVLVYVFHSINCQDMLRLIILILI